MIVAYSDGGDETWTEYFVDHSGRDIEVIAPTLVACQHLHKWISYVIEDIAKWVCRKADRIRRREQRR